MLAKLRKIDIIVYVNKKEVLMNKEELVKEVAKKAKVSQKAAADVIAATLETVTKSVAKGQKVTLVGFGTFEPRKRAARSGRNPQMVVTHKLALQSKLLLKQFLLSQLVKNSKKLLSSFFIFIKEEVVMYFRPLFFVLFV